MCKRLKSSVPYIRDKVLPSIEPTDKTAYQEVVSASTKDSTAIAYALCMHGIDWLVRDLRNEGEHEVVDHSTVADNLQDNAEAVVHRLMTVPAKTTQTIVTQKKRPSQRLTQKMDHQAVEHAAVEKLQTLIDTEASKAAENTRQTIQESNEAIDEATSNAVEEIGKVTDDKVEELQHTIQDKVAAAVESEVSSRVHKAIEAKVTDEIAQSVETKVATTVEEELAKTRESERKERSSSIRMQEDMQHQIKEIYMANMTLKNQMEQLQNTLEKQKHQQAPVRPKRKPSKVSVHRLSKRNARKKSPASRARAKRNKPNVHTVKKRKQRAAEHKKKIQRIEEQIASLPRSMATNRHRQTLEEKLDEIRMRVNM